MHLTVTLFDGESSPRSFMVEPVSPMAEGILTHRIIQSLRSAIGSNKVTTDTLTGVTYPPLPKPEAEKFENAYIALYMNPGAFRELMADPAKFPALIKRFQPKEAK